jgi:hypothetical protein
MMEWQAKQPKLFTKRVVNHTEPDIQVTAFSEGSIIVLLTVIDAFELSRGKG